MGDDKNIKNENPKKTNTGKPFKKKIQMIIRIFLKSKKNQKKIVNGLKIRGFNPLIKYKNGG